MIKTVVQCPEILRNIVDSHAEARIVQENQVISSYSIDIYRKTSSTSRTKSQSLNVSCIPVQLFSLNPLKPGVKLRMKM